MSCELWVLQNLMVLIHALYQLNCDAKLCSEVLHNIQICSPFGCPTFSPLCRPVQVWIKLNNINYFLLAHVCFLPLSTTHTHTHYTTNQVMRPCGVSSWTCCYAGGQSFVIPHPNHLKEKRCLKTWWPLTLFWETSTLTTAPQVWSYLS